MQTQRSPYLRERPPSPEELASAAAALEKVLQDEDAEVRENAERSLAYIRRAVAGEIFEGK
jgi:HEAT repeat protein